MGMVATVQGEGLKAAAVVVVTELGLFVRS
jgi:hypothetical protein